MNGKRKLRTITASAGVLGTIAAGTADADIVAPPGLNPGDKFQIVFLSTTSTDAVNSGPGFYDLIVSGDAAANGLSHYKGSPVTWSTFGSFFQGQSAETRFSPTSPAFTLDGDRIANNASDWYDGTIQNPINVRPDLSVANVSVWTGSGVDGSESVFKEIGNVTGMSRYGLSSAVDSTWISAGNLNNSSAQFLYAFSNELTVVPESTWIGAFSGVVMALFAWFRKKR